MDRSQSKLSVEVWILKIGPLIINGPILKIQSSTDWDRNLFISSNISRILEFQKICRIKLHFWRWKCANNAKYLIESWSSCSNLLEISIAARNDLAPIWRQDISWSNADKNLGWLESTREVYELMYISLMGTCGDPYDTTGFYSTPSTFPDF